MQITQPVPTAASRSRGIDSAPEGSSKPDPLPPTGSGQSCSSKGWFAGRPPAAISSSTGGRTCTAASMTGGGATDQQAGSNRAAVLQAALLQAAARDDLQTIATLLQSGLSPDTSLPWRPPGSAEPREPDAAGAFGGSFSKPALERSLLCLAAFYGSLAAARCLLQFGATPNFASRDDGCTPLHSAAAGGSNNTALVIELLLQHGANRDAVDFCGRRPVELLASHSVRLQKELRQRQQQALNDVYMAAMSRLRDATAADSTFDEFDVAVGPHVPDPSGGANSDINRPEYSTDEFRMNSFKVVKCTKTHAHDWTECPFVHPGEKARRRSPLIFAYTSAACPDFRKGVCRRGDRCCYSHGVFECWLHPSRYRTQMCKDGSRCTRRVCFFAHALSELRSPSPEPQTEIMPPTLLGSPVKHPWPLSPAASPLTSPQSSSSDMSTAITFSFSNVTNALMGLLPAGALQSPHTMATLHMQNVDAVAPVSAPWQQQLPMATEQHGLPHCSGGCYSPALSKLQDWPQQTPGYLSPPSMALQSPLPQPTSYPGMYAGSHLVSKGKAADVLPTPGSAQTSWMAMGASDVLAQSGARDQPGGFLDVGAGSPSLRRCQTDNRRSASPSHRSGHGNYEDGGGNGAPVLRRCLTDAAKYDLPGSDSYRACEQEVERSGASAPAPRHSRMRPPQPLEASRWLQPQQQVSVSSPVQPHLPWLAELRAREDELTRVGSLSLLDVSWVESLTGPDHPQSSQGM